MPILLNGISTAQKADSTQPTAALATGERMGLGSGSSGGIGGSSIGVAVASGKTGDMIVGSGVAIGTIVKTGSGGLGDGVNVGVGVGVLHSAAISSFRP